MPDGFLVGSSGLLIASKLQEHIAFAIMGREIMGIQVSSSIICFQCFLVALKVPECPSFAIVGLGQMGIELGGLFISGQGFLVSLSPVEQVTSFCMKDGTVRVENGMLVGRQSFFTAPEAAKHAAFGFRLLRGLLKSGALQ